MAKWPYPWTSSPEAGKNRLHFVVSDTGIGIPVDKQSLIFDAFAQADSTATRNFGGTGLGLTISSRLVQMMGGRIWVESQPHQGSRFHFTAELPAVETASARRPLPKCVLRACGSWWWMTTPPIAAS